MEIKRGNKIIEKEIHNKLIEYNKDYAQYIEEISYYIEEDGKNIGGVVATALGKTLEIDFLFLDKEYRGKGYAKKIMLKLEEEAKKMDIIKIILNTYEFQAPEFYEKLGYKTFCKLENAWEEYDKFYFYKEI